MHPVILLSILLACTVQGDALHGMRDPEALANEFRLDVGDGIRRYNSEPMSAWPRHNSGSGRSSDLFSQRTGSLSHHANSQYVVSNAVESHPEPTYSMPYSSHYAMQSKKRDGSRCSGTQFYCAWDDRCLYRGRVCDGQWDCAKGEDEEHCQPMQRFRSQPQAIPAPAAVKDSKAPRPIPSLQVPEVPKSKRQNDVLPIDPEPEPVQVNYKQDPAVAAQVPDGPRLVPVHDKKKPPVRESNEVEPKVPPPSSFRRTSKAEDLRETVSRLSNPALERTGDVQLSHLPVPQIIVPENPHKPKEHERWDRKYQQPQPSVKPAPKQNQEVKQENIGMSGRIVEHKMSCQCTCTPTIF